MRQNPSAPYADSTQASNQVRHPRAGGSGGAAPPDDECGSMALWCLMLRP